MGRLRMGESAERGFSLPTPRSYRGRVGAAIPTAGIVLPSERGGTKPVAYSTSNLPSGLSFNAGTRAITGSPTAAHATREVTYSATDSATPAETVSATFEFPVVAQAAAATHDDWDNRGYGLETRTTYMLALIESQGDVGFSDENLWLRPPQTGTPTGKLLDDDGTELTDFASMTFTAGGENVFVSRVLIRQGSDRVVFYETSALHFGTYARDVLGRPTLYVRIANEEEAVPYNSGFSADLQFRRSSPDLGEFLREIDVGTRVLLGVAAP